MQATASKDTANSDWLEIGQVKDIPKLGARVVKAGEFNIAVFRTDDDEIFALRDECPHKGGPLSQGIVHGKKVACPLHDWKIHLDSGDAVAPDEGCAASFPVRIDGDKLFLSLTPNEGCPNK